jgi:hypothetical protein
MRLWMRSMIFQSLAVAALVGCDSTGKDPGMQSVTPPEYLPLSSPEVSWMVGEWITEPGYESKKIVIQANPPGLVYEWHRNLVEVSELGPEPILCSYRYFTDRFGIRRGGTDVARSADFSVVAHMNHVELLPDDGISWACLSFVEQETTNIQDVPYVIDVVRGRSGELIQDGWVHRKIER